MTTKAASKPLLTYSRAIYDYLIKFVESGIFVKLIYLWFVVQAVYMALSTAYGIPPDEAYHVAFIKLFAHNGWLPFLNNENGYYFLGEVTKTPFFLYHYLLSLPYHLFGSSSHALLYLRFINIGLALGSLVLVNRIASQLKVSRAVKNLSFFMIVNTLMFVFLSASVSYDNLFILFTLASITLLLNLIQKFTLSSFLLLINVLLLGTLIKIAFIPIMLALVFVLFKYRARSFAPRKVLRAWRARRLLNTLLVSLLLIASILVVQRYVVNVIAYHALSPACTRVHTAQECSQGSIQTRDASIQKYYSPATIDSFGYLSEWTVLMSDWTFGILGDWHVEPTRLINTWYKILLVLAIVSVIRSYNPKEKKMNILLGIILFYMALLIFNNYRSYQHSGLIFLAVQGRYLFGLLPIMYILANYNIFKLLAAKYLKFIYICLTLVIFLSAGLPSYIISTDQSWHTQRTIRLNQKLHDILVNAYRLRP